MKSYWFKRVEKRIQNSSWTVQCKLAARFFEKALHHKSIALNGVPAHVFYTAVIVFILTVTSSA
jgi:hypothetical protein